MYTGGCDFATSRKGFWRRPSVRVPVLLTAFFLLLLTSFGAVGAEVSECRKLLILGEYEKCLEMASKAAGENRYEEEWRLLQAQALMATGRYPEAKEVIVNALSRYTTSIRSRMLACSIFRANGSSKRVESLLKEIDYLAGTRRWAYTDAKNLVALGDAALWLKLDARQVLDNFYNVAKKSDSNYRDVYLASGNLALGKNDFETSANVFFEALRKFSEDPDIHFGLAQSFASGDREVAIEHLKKTLELNPNHVAAMLMRVDYMIDSERYAAANETLQQAMKVNPWSPEAWAYQAVLEHLDNNPKGEALAREKGLRYWAANPEVDHLIGKKLSGKYRFKEGAAYQRRALKSDPDHLQAKSQLATDLLRLGDDAAGWALAKEVNEEDGYDVNAFNLVALNDTMSKFETISNDDFIVRMSPHEKSIYGDKVLDLLGRAKKILCDKYGMELETPTIVEIFPKQSDFAVRTFGVPGVDGFLGVCFGRLITANSPASRVATPSNWEAVLWHEFCHVVTLSMTRNKMPRWLSEGISVYEELQENPVWGQSMTPEYREMVLGEDLTPVGELSSAFMAPKSGMHLQFAYYESALVVEYLIKNHGLESLRKILRDLGRGRKINETIAAHTEPMEELEKKFKAFAIARAENLAPDLDWEKPDIDPRRANVDELIASHPKNYWILTQQAKRLLQQKQYEAAKAPLRKLIKAYPKNVESADNPYALLAMAHRGLEEGEEERKVLETLSALSPDSLGAYLRLMEIGSEKEDWKSVETNGERYLAVNPLLPQPYRYLALAREANAKPDEAIDAYRVMLRLDPPDPAETHFRLARLLHEKKDPATRRHILQALEEAPRYRDAHKLLLAIVGGDKPEAAVDKPAPPPVPALKPASPAK
ncbi:MAG: tetratricopeptide (TPR) repeat protein [Candidatus Binatia bacterium]|jgi:tetratricopeptide (TPR) repeat protein